MHTLLLLESQSNPYRLVACKRAKKLRNSYVLKSELTVKNIFLFLRLLMRGVGSGPWQSLKASRYSLYLLFAALIGRLR